MNNYIKRKADKNKKISIEQPTASTNDYGEKINTYTTYLSSLWASIEPISGRQYFASQQVQSEVTHIVALRYQDGITTDMRVVFGDRRFRIISALNLKERNDELNLMCEEVV